MTDIVLYLARAMNGVIGRDGRLPWSIPADLRRFKAMTLDKPLLMGRRTFEGLPGLLPRRRHIVLTRDAAWSAAGAEPVATLDAALALAGDAPELAVIGGAQVYAAALPLARRVELTEVHDTPAGDTTVPAFAGWRETAREDHEGYSFVTLARAA